MKARVQEENSQSISPPFSQGWAASLAILCFFHSSSFHDPVATKKQLASDPARQPRFRAVVTLPSLFGIVVANLWLT